MILKFKRFILSTKRFSHALNNNNYFDSNSIFSNLIKIKNKKPEDLYKKNFKLPHFVYDNNIEVLKLYPSSVEEFNDCCEKLRESGIFYLLKNINPDEDILIQDGLCSYSKIEGYEYNFGRYHKNYNFYNIPKDEVNKYIFNNNQPGKSFYFKKYYLYDHPLQLKLSPNILRIYHFDGLTEKIIRSVLEGYTINRIDPPNTQTGYWMLYAGNKYSYMNLLSSLFKYENNNFLIEPHYQAANIYPIHNKSKNIIEIYTSSEKLSSLNKLKEAINCDDCVIFPKKLHNGYFHTFYFNNLNLYEDLIYKNGLPLNGTTDYIMNFGDKISLNNISKNQIFLYFSKEFKSSIIKKLNDYDFEISKNGNCAIIYPRSYEELDRLNEGIEINEKLYFINSSRIFDLKVKNTVNIQKPKFQHDTEYFLKSVFKPISYSSYTKSNSIYKVYFKKEDYFTAFFKNKPFCSLNIDAYSSTLNFVNDKFYFLPCFLDIYTKEKDCVDINKLKFPFNYHIVRLKNQQKNMIKVRLKDFQIYSFQKIDIDGYSFEFRPLILEINEERTSFKCANINSFELYINRLFSENIMFTADEENFVIYPKFNNNDQLRIFFILYSNWNFESESLSGFNVGKDILNL